MDGRMAGWPDGRMAVPFGVGRLAEVVRKFAKFAKLLFSHLACVSKSFFPCQDQLFFTTTVDSSCSGSQVTTEAFKALSRRAVELWLLGFIVSPTPLESLRIL
jgi:hypothetical protein